MNTYFVVYTDGTTVTIYANDLMEVADKAEKDIRSLVLISD
jgi:hypothetical protein